MPLGPAFRSPGSGGGAPARRLYLGWEVADWCSGMDGFAAMIWREDNTLEAFQARTSSTQSDLCGPPFSLERLAQALRVQDEFSTAERVVLGINAPLGLPVRYQVAAVSGIDAAPAPEAATAPFMESRLAFRETDRLMAKYWPGALSSPSLSQRANCGSRARAHCGELRRGKTPPAIPPFHLDDPKSTRLVVIEVCPAVWLSHSLAPLAKALAPPIGRPGSSLRRNAHLCALNAAAYDLSIAGYWKDVQCVGGDGRGREQPPIPPRMASPEGWARRENAHSAEVLDAIRREGWIYAPLPA